MQGPYPCFPLYICWILSYSYLLPHSVSVSVISCFATTTPKILGFGHQPLFGIPQKPGQGRLCWAVLLLCVVLAGAAVIQGLIRAGVLQRPLSQGRRRMLAPGWEFSQHSHWNTSHLIHVAPAPAAWGLAFTRGSLECAEVEVASALRARPPKSLMTPPIAFCWSKQSQGQLPREGKTLDL